MNDHTISRAESDGVPRNVPRSTVNDLVIEDLALGEAESIARIADLESERDTYRDLLQSALAVAHDVTSERDRLRRQLSDLRQEYRSFRERVLSDLGAAA